MGDLMNVSYYRSAMEFVRLRDESGEIQIALDAKRLSETDVALRKLLDLGDIVSVEGSLGTTKKGETTIWADKLMIACKTLTPPPEKWEGLTDVEARYRQRYADLAYNPDVMRVMKLRIQIVDAMRTFMKGKGFEEVETPMLQPIHGGAAARPFETHHRALDMKLFLRIAPELYLKRLLVGGFTKVFEINRNFRNEGISPKHNPEFTMLEAYWAFASWEKMADLVEDMIATIAQQVLGTLEIPRAGSRELARESVTESTGDHVKHASLPSVPPVIPTEPDNAPVLPEQPTINLARPWRRVPMATLVEEVTGWKFDKQSIASHPHAVTRAVAVYEPDGVNALARQAAGLQLFGEEERAANRAKSFEHHLLSLSPAEQLTELYEKLVEPNLIDPCFVTRVPGVIVPLARRCKDDDYFADVYELAINGQEISPGYTELNDPDVQAEHFRHQVGDREEQQKVDEDFLTALKYGMPPAGGIGLGIDRFVAMLTGQASLRDVILFPLMRTLENK